MKELKMKKCPFCEYDLCDVIQTEYQFGFQVICINCGTRGPIGKTESKAISAWNHRS